MKIVIQLSSNTNFIFSTVTRNSWMFQMIDKYLQNTHAATHNQYKMKILDVFDMAKHGEAGKFNDCGNRCVIIIIQPRHEKTCFSHMQTTKVQISLGSHAFWSALLLFAS